MITIHHLGVSQSDRVVWLMEELGLPYKLQWYNRGADGLMPPDYLGLHPAGTAPVIQDGDTMITESAVILEYICRRYGGGKFTVGPEQPNYYDYLYWMHFHNSILGLFFVNGALRLQTSSDSERMRGFIKRREDRYFNYLDQRLSKVSYLAGDELTCADFLMMFDLTFLCGQGLRSVDELAHVKAYMARVAQRPAYIKAMQIAGPAAKPPGA
jgi:glutathione S-transferase